MSLTTCSQIRCEEARFHVYSSMGPFAGGQGRKSGFRFLTAAAVYWHFPGGQELVCSHKHRPLHRSQHLRFRVKKSRNPVSDGRHKSWDKSRTKVNYFGAIYGRREEAEAAKARAWGEVCGTA